MANSAAISDADLGAATEPSVVGIGAIVGVLVSTILVFAAIELWVAWADERRAAIDELTTVVELEAVAVDAYLSRIQADLEAFGNGVRTPGGKVDVDQALVLARQLNQAHPELSDVSVIQPDGSLLLTADKGHNLLPHALASEPSFVESLRAFQDGASTNIGPPSINLPNKLAISPMRHAIRNAQGHVQFIVSASVPHTHLHSFWRNAPITNRAAIGILLDNGYLLSRFPEPPDRALQDVYGQVRSGAVIQYLRLNHFPTQGELQGTGSLEGVDALAVFRRLPNHRLTLYVMLPMSQIWQTWRSRVGVSLLSLLMLLVGLSWAYWLLLTRKRQASLARKAGELALTESELRFKGIIENAGSVMLLVEPYSGRIIEANQAAAAFYGYPKAVLIGMTIEQITHRPAQDEVASRQLTMDDAPQYCLSMHQLASGEARDVEIYSNSIALKGQPVGFYIVNDITERKTSANLLQAAKSDAERANNAKSRFLAAASHDLRQPLTALGLYLEVLKSRSGYADEKLQANLNSCTTSLGQLLTDLLDISKLQAGVVVPEPSHFSVSNLLSRLMAVHMPSAQDKGLRLRWRPCSTTAHTDEVLLTRILGNLIANAIRYTDQGGLLIACRRRQGKTWVEVWDSGIGIPDGKTQEIFEEYLQLNPNNPSRSSGSIGSGLGLAIVAKTAALLGLQIRVHSRIGKGSLFAVELPLAAHSPTPQPRVLSAQSLRIALVEDNAEVLDALCSALQSRGHQVVAAATGAELLRLLGDKAPDVIVSDYRLRDGEIGTDVTDAVMQAFGKRLPVLIVTGDTDPDVLRDLRIKADLVLNKPLNFEQLLASIARLAQ